MEITLIGKPERLHTNLVFEALTHYGEALMSKRMLHNISIRIVVVRGLIRKERIDADCIWEDINIRPREFTIRIDSDMGKKKTLLALAHEMIHVKQYAIGEMQDYLKSSGVLKWKNALFERTPDNYHERPWEIEAHEKESVLYNSFDKRRKERKQNEKDGKTQPDCSGSAHTFILKAYSGEQEDL